MRMLDASYCVRHNSVFQQLHRRWGRQEIVRVARLLKGTRPRKGPVSYRYQLQLPFWFDLAKAASPLGSRGQDATPSSGMIGSAA